MVSRVTGELGRNILACNLSVFRISDLESLLKTMMLRITTLKTSARGRADAHERFQANIDSMREGIAGQKALFENFALLAKRDERDGQRGKGQGCRWKFAVPRDQLG